jgi:prevent-host-death family protein
MATVAAGQAKAQFLKLLKDVELKRETVIVTKHGREVAKLVPIELAEDVDPLDKYRYPGLEIVGDIEAPIYTDAEWQEFENASLAQLNDPY